MGKFAKSVGKHKTPKRTVSEDKLFVRKTWKQSKRITDAGIAQANLINRNVVSALSGLSYIFFAHIMHVQERVSVNQVIKMLEGIRDKLDSVNRNLTTWHDIQEFEVKSTDPEFYPIKWTDYRKLEHDYRYMLNTIPAKTDAESISAIAKVTTIQHAEHITHNFELCIMSALHDFFGYGKKRLMRIVGAYRKMLYLTPEKLKEIVADVCNFSVFIPDETNNVIMEKHERFWRICLMDKEWEGNYLAS